MLILTDSLWRRKFSADPAIVGRKIVLGGAPHEVVGVSDSSLWLFRGRQLSPDLDLPDRIDVFLPLRLTVREEQGEPNHAYLAIGRLKQGVTPEQAAAEAQVTIPSFLYENDERIILRVKVERLQSALFGPVRKALSLLLAAVGFVLMIVSVNMANLLLVRAAGREREFAIRAALGATRWNLVVESLAESSLLSAVGLLGALAVASWAMPLVVASAPADMARVEQTTLDLRVLIFAVSLTIATALLFGLLPACRFSMFSVNRLLHSASRAATEGRRSGKIRAVLVGFEAALATVLLVTAGLLLISFQRVLRAPRGFVAENVLSADVALPPAYNTYNLQAGFYRRVREGLAAAPGALNVAAISVIPLQVEGNVAPAVREGTERVPIGEQPMASWPSLCGPDSDAPLSRPGLAPGWGKRDWSGDGRLPPVGSHDGAR